MKFKPKSKAFKKLFELVKDHHEACGCGACLAMLYWDEEDDKNALWSEKKQTSSIEPHKGHSLRKSTHTEKFNQEQADLEREIRAYHCWDFTCEGEDFIDEDRPY